MKLPSYLFCCILFLLMQGCGPGKPGVYKNDQISSGLREDFHKLNDQLFEGIKANKPRDVESLMSKELITSDYKRTLELTSIQSQLGSYTLLDEFYIVNYKPTDTHKLKTIATDGSTYNFYCTAPAEELYLAFMVPKTKGDKYLITAVYAKYSYGWKLNDFSLQNYTVNGKTAPQLYNIALANYDKGYLIDAYTNMELADMCMRPNRFWLYPQDSLMIGFRNKIGHIVNGYKYPLIIDGVPTEPKIFEITHQTDAEGIFPAVYYLTTVNIKDNNALKKENDQIRKAIGNLLPGIDKDKQFIFFSAFNQLPTSTRTAASYDWVYKLKE